MIRNKLCAGNSTGASISEGDPPILAIEDHAAILTVEDIEIEPGATGDMDFAGGQACFVCMDVAADAVLLECGHGGLCAGDDHLP